MVYINSRGEVVEKKSLSWSTPFELILAFLNFIYIFFQTLLPFGSRFGDSSNRSSRGSRGGGGGGWGGPGGGGGGGPKGPRIRTLGSCGGPNAPPAGG